MKLTTVCVAMALSPCNKAITMRSDGVHIVAERTAWKSGYDLIYISNDMQKLVARYVDKSKEDFFKLLRIDGILDDYCVWRPVTDAVIERLQNKMPDLYDKAVVEQLMVEALTTDGSHHKQWYLWELAEFLGLSLDIDADKGIAP